MNSRSGVSSAPAGALKIPSRNTARGPAAEAVAERIVRPGERSTAQCMDDPARHRRSSTVSGRFLPRISVAEAARSEPAENRKTGRNHTSRYLLIGGNEPSSDQIGKTIIGAGPWNIFYSALKRLTLSRRACHKHASLMNIW